MVLEELRRTFDQYAHSADILDDKAQGLLSASSIVMGLFSLLQLSLVGPGQSLIYQTGVVLIIIGYLIIIALCINVLHPRKYKNAISTDWNTLSSYLLDKENSQAYETLISTYLASIEENKKMNLEKARRLNLAVKILPMLIVGMFILSLFPH